MSRFATGPPSMMMMRCHGAFEEKVRPSSPGCTVSALDCLALSMRRCTQVRFALRPVGAGGNMPVIAM